MAFTVRDGLHVEELDDGFLVLRTRHMDAVHLVGDQVAAFVLARGGADEIPVALQPAMAGLIELDIVRSDTWSRRRVIQLGGGAAAAAAALVAFPSVVAAASPPGSADSSIPASSGLALSYLVVAGGGAGSNSGLTDDNGGGGAGGVREGTATLERGSHQVTVGAGATYQQAGNSRLGTIVEATRGGTMSDGGSGAGGNVLEMSGWPGISGQGHDGGSYEMGYVGDDWSGAAAGGGGGASAMGGDGEITSQPWASAGAGGDGIQSVLAAAVGIGSPLGWVGGGGGGGSIAISRVDQPSAAGRGGRGGGGRGAGLFLGNVMTDGLATAGATNTGGGGGGGGGGMDGGSGVVIVAYALAGAAMFTVTGGTISDDGVTRSHLFTDSGVLAIS